MSCQVFGYEAFCNKGKHLCHVKYLAMRLYVTRVNISVMSSTLLHEAFCINSKHMCHVKNFAIRLSVTTVYICVMSSTWL